MALGQLPVPTQHEMANLGRERFSWLDQGVFCPLTFGSCVSQSSKSTTISFRWDTMIMDVSRPNYPNRLQSKDEIALRNLCSCCYLPSNKKSRIASSNVRHWPFSNNVPFWKRYATSSFSFGYSCKYVISLSKEVLKVVRRVSLVRYQ